jgi:hypothetical protein
MKAPMAKVAAVQAVYFLITGLWPIVSRRSFEKVTGPKTDFWLVETVGSLIGVVGSALLVSATREGRSPESLLLGVGSAAALGAADVVFALRKVVSKVYLVDAALEAALIAAWAVAAQRERAQGS